MCISFDLSNITKVKVIGPKIGRGHTSGMRDADNDGKCQEEDGKWIPCPPGVPDGHVVNAAGQALRTIGKPIGQKPADDPLAANRKKAAEKAAKIAAQADKAVTKEQRFLAGQLPMLVDDYMQSQTSGERRALREDIRDSIIEMMNHQIDGLDGKKYRIEIDPDDITIGQYEGIHMLGYFTNERGTRVGHFERTINIEENRVDHDILKLNEAHQNAGIASAFNARNEILYREMGLQTIHVGGLSSPTGYKGATHWPKNGYDWASERDKLEFITTIKAAIRRHKTEKNKNGASEYFNNDQQVEYIEKLIRQAQTQDLEQANRITAGDLLNWPGAEQWFQATHANIEYTRPL